MAHNPPPAVNAPHVPLEVPFATTLDDVVAGRSKTLQGDDGGLVNARHVVLDVQNLFATHVTHSLPPLYLMKEVVKE